MKSNKSNNIFQDIISNSNKEIFDILFQNQSIKIERILSYGQTSPVNFWYNQNENEFVLLLKGKAKIEFEDKTVILKSGDYLHIPKYKKHRVSYTALKQTTIWLAIFFR